MASYSEKYPPPSPTIASFQQVLVRRHRSLSIACLILLAVTSFYTLLAVGFGSHGDAPTEMRLVTLRKGDASGHLRSLIPPKIWQIMLPKRGDGGELYNVDPDQLKETSSWLAKNIDYEYHLVGPRTADDFVESNFASYPRLLSAYRNIPNMGMKSDLLRYLLLSREGGVYSDIDTVAIRPIDAWIPRRLRDHVRLVVGIEFDKRDGANWADIPHDLQFCQWTIAAAPGHPVFAKMVDRLLDSLDDMVVAHNNTPLAEIVPGSFEVMNSTGPAAWTDVVFETLQGFDPSLNETKDLSFMTTSRVIGDVLILPINGFGMGQGHSASTNDGTIPPEALIQHMFWGSWREPENHDEEEQGEGQDKTEDDQTKTEEDQVLEAEQRLQEAQKAEEEARKLQAEAEASRQQEAQKQQEVQRLEEEAQRQQQQQQHEASYQSQPAAAPSPASQPASADVSPATSQPSRETESVPEAQTEPPSDAHPATERENDKEEEEEEEVLLMDTGAPSWPGPEFAP
ncbi:glycosyltransferase sugar-binding region containing DXD motif domain-containing protein [Sarocladium implicatum]|nr:glycosyltransferase sugar-binding region containing DXD motif domain-containing protein [Sarocladium implicatum]